MSAAALPCVSWSRTVSCIGLLQRISWIKKGKHSWLDLSRFFFTFYSKVIAVFLFSVEYLLSFYFVASSLVPPMTDGGRKGGKKER